MPRSPRPVFCLLALVAFCLAACDSGSDAPADPVRIAGRYVAVLGPNMPPQALTFDLVLAEAAGGAVVGQGTFFNEKGTATVTATGTRDGTGVQLSLRDALIPAATPGRVVATVSADARLLSGTYTGIYSNGATRPLTFTRTAP